MTLKPSCIVSAIQDLNAVGSVVGGRGESEKVLITSSMNTNQRDRSRWIRTNQEPSIEELIWINSNVSSSITS